MTEFSVVTPTFNEVANVREFYERVSKALDGISADWELIFAVDPSSDGTEDEILGIRNDDRRVKMLRFSRRFGQPASTLAGLAFSTGRAVVVIDCDLQDPPEVIPELVLKWHEGYDVVYAQRRSRKGETIAKRVVAWLGYRVIRRIAEVEIPENTGDFRLMSRRVVDQVVLLREEHGFLRGLVALVGFSQTAVPYDRAARPAGKSKYNKTFGSVLIGMNGIVSFSRYPLQLISIVGVITSVFAFLLAVFYFVAKLAGVPFPLGNPTIVIIIALFSGVQLLSLGVMGEYVGRIYDEVKGRPRFIVESAYGLEPDAVDESPARSS